MLSENSCESVLRRMFSERNQRFLLKGDSNLLACIPGACATSDVDAAAYRQEMAESALESVLYALGDMITNLASNSLTLLCRGCRYM